MAPTGADDPPAGYRRSTGSARGLARREALLAAITDDVAEHGLVGFSLRRAATAAGTTHKVLLYHFHDVDELLAGVAVELRARRVSRGLASALAHGGPSLADRVRVLWPVLVGAEQDALMQAMGLAIHDPARHAALVRGSAVQYLDALRGICPAAWSDERRSEIAELVLATLRGLLLAQRVEPDVHDVDAGLAALDRALRCEEARDKM